MGLCARSRSLPKGSRSSGRAARLAAALFLGKGARFGGRRTGLGSGANRGAKRNPASSKGTAVERLPSRRIPAKPPMRELPRLATDLAPGSSGGISQIECAGFFWLWHRFVTCPRPTRLGWPSSLDGREKAFGDEHGKARVWLLRMARKSCSTQAGARTERAPSS